MREIELMVFIISFPVLVKTTYGQESRRYLPTKNPLSLCATYTQSDSGFFSAWDFRDHISFSPGEQSNCHGSLNIREVNEKIKSRKSISGINGVENQRGQD